MAKNRVTIKDNVEFVKLMIDRDLAELTNNGIKLAYLKSIDDHVNELSEAILSINKDVKPASIVDLGASPKHDDMIGPDAHSIGEDRPEIDFGDIDTEDILASLRQAMPEATIVPLSAIMGEDYVPPEMALFNKLFEIVKPKDYEGLDLVDFIKSGECLQGAEAYDWLYARKYPHKYQHIHIYPHDLCLLLPDDDPDDDIMDNGAAWIKPDGVSEEGDMMKIFYAMFGEYVEKETASG